MPEVTFFSSLDGHKCSECGEVFLTPVTIDLGPEYGEAHGVRYAEPIYQNTCPACGAWDLDECRVCANCEEAESVTTDGKCLECDPVVETEEQQT